MGDHLWAAGWWLHRIAEDFDIEITVEPRPTKGNWNGVGCHTNDSTKAKCEDGGMMGVITAACESLGKDVDKPLAVYGTGLEDRLTGAQETASYREFLYGVGNRAASIRIPLHVSQPGKGYLEDRRPCFQHRPRRGRARVDGVD